MGCRGSKGVKDLEGTPLSILDVLPDTKGDKQEAALRQRLKQEMVSTLGNMKELKSTVKLLEQEKSGLSIIINGLRDKLVVQVSNSEVSK